jgi:arylformamidase
MSRQSRRIVDLSLDIYPGAPSFPGDPACQFNIHDTIASVGYNLTQICFGSHQGTHLDAPYHFYGRGKTVDQVDLERCVGPATVVDFSWKQPKESITVADFAPYEPIVQPGARILLRLGWDKMLGQPGYFTDFPSMTTELANWLASRKIALIGMDSPGPSADQWKDVHLALLAAEVVIVEGLANLEQLPTGEVFFVAAPLRLQGLDGSPVRALALLD